MKKIWFAQLLRGIAALLVVIAHLFVCRLYFIGGDVLHDPYLVTLSPFNTYQQLYDCLVQNFFINLGAVGVGIFFLISGFVISFSISKRTKVNFLLNRLLRIYPVVIAVLIVDFILLRLYHLTFVGGGVDWEPTY